MAAVSQSAYDPAKQFTSDSFAFGFRHERQDDDLSRHCVPEAVAKESPVLRGRKAE